MCQNCINSFSFCRIYLVDHAWTFRPEDARLQLQQYPGLLERMANLFDLSTEDIEKEDLIDQVSLNTFSLNYFLNYLGNGKNEFFWKHFSLILVTNHI